MSEEKFTFDDSTLAGKVGLHLLDRAEKAEAEVVWLEALFQRTHGVHHSWVAEVTRLQEALEVIATCPPEAVHLMPLAAQAALSGPATTSGQPADAGKVKP